MVLSELANEIENINRKIKQILKDLNFEYDIWPEETSYGENGL